MWANDLQKKQSVCKEYYKPRPCFPGWHDRGINRPAPPNRPGPTQPQSTRGQSTRPNRCKTPPIAPSKRGQPTGPTNPARSNPSQSTPSNQPGLNPRPNNRPIAGGQSPRKRAKRSTRANPQQTPNNPANGNLK
jgi:hypothetical protein